MPSKSKAQQRFMGMVHATKKGEMKNPPASVKKAAKGMSKKSAHKYASTKHQGKPEKVKKETKVSQLIRKMVREIMAEIDEGGKGSGRPRAATPATDKDNKRPTKNPFSKESPAHKTWEKKKSVKEDDVVDKEREKQRADKEKMRDRQFRDMERARERQKRLDKMKKEGKLSEKMRPAVKKLLKQKGYAPIFTAIDNSKRQFKQMRYSRGEIQDTLIDMFGDEDPKILKKIKEGFAGGLKKEDQKKFEKSRKESAEVLGYTLTGKSDLKTEIDKLEEEINDITKHFVMESRIAKTILQQLGGNKFIAMTGAKNLGASNKSLSMKIGRNSKSINYVVITLKSSDLYEMEFIRMRGAKRTVVKKVKGVYADQLQTMFTKYTGMNTRL